MSNSKRRVAVPVGIELLANLMRKNTTTDRMVTLKGVPPDALHVGEFVDQQKVFFVFEHESFNPVECGELLPIVDVEICLLSNAEQRE